MQNEAAFLEDLGVVDPLSRIYIDTNAYVITPYHILINQLLVLHKGKEKREKRKRKQKRENIGEDKIGEARRR
jgi:hypothetical protein